MLLSKRNVKNNLKQNCTQNCRGPSVAWLCTPRLGRGGPRLLGWTERRKEGWVDGRTGGWLGSGLSTERGAA